MPATQAVLTQLEAIYWEQQAPDMLLKALKTKGPEGDAQVRIIIEAFPALLGKEVGPNKYLPLFYALEARAWGKAALLIELGAGTTDLFKYLLYHGTTFKIPELETVLEAQFTAWLEAIPNPFCALPTLLERGRPDWAWRYCIFELKNGQTLLNKKAVRDFMFAQTDKLAELLALPNLVWPSLVGQNMPLESWLLFAQQRPDLLAVPKRDGTTLLHVANKEWIKLVAGCLSDEILTKMLVATAYDDHNMLTPWLKRIHGGEFAEAQALWKLAKERSLRVDLAAQHTPTGRSALHLAFTHERGPNSDSFIRWLMDDCGLDIRAKNKRGQEAWKLPRC
jgi:hypothetical protein